MTNVEVGVGSIANVLSALESIGFTVDTTNSTAKWGYDTNNNLYFKAETNSSNTILKLYNSSNSAIHFGITVAQATQLKMTYERIGNSVVFGFVPLSAAGNSIQVMIVEPKDTEDNWLYCVGFTNSTSGKNNIINGATQNSDNYVLKSLYNGSANGVQLCKYYDGLRFCGNLYETAMCASVPLMVNGSGSTTTNNYIEATVGTDTFLIVNLDSSTNGSGSALSNKLAIKKTALTS